MIERKLLPPLAPTDLVERPRLDARLVDLIEKQRVLRICATPGAGKTTAAAEAIRAGKRDVAWLTVDYADGAPGRLMTYLEGALSRPFRDLSGIATRALPAGLPHPEAG